MTEERLRSIADDAARGGWCRCGSPEDGPLTNNGWRYVRRQWVVEVFFDPAGEPERAEISGWPAGATRAEARRAVLRLLRSIEEDTISA